MENQWVIWLLVPNVVAICAILIDIIVGDPKKNWHPICIVGTFISICERALLKVDDTPSKKRLKGKMLVFIVTFCAVTLVGGLIFIAYRLHFIVGIVVESILGSFMLASKSLKKSSTKVYNSLIIGDEKQARLDVSMIVGRDTQRLDKEGILRATIETIAENTSDGVVAPNFYMMLFGVIGGIFYKAINTMDSMVGYVNDKYVDFGRAAAKMDDVMNFIPSRISGVFMVLSAKLCGYDAKNAWYIFKRDRKKHKSPNSAQTESACAGALGLKLAGNAWYGGVLHEKPYIGDEKKKIEKEDIKCANKLMLVTHFTTSLFFILVKFVIVLMLYILLEG